MHGRKTFGRSIDWATAIPPVVPRLWRFGLRLTGSSRDADRLAWSACRHALSNTTAHGPGESPVITLFAALCSSWVAEANARRRYWTAIGMAEHRVDADATGETMSHGSAGSLPEWLRAAVRQLPDDERVVLLLAHVEGFTHQEAADILGITLDAAKARLAHARIKLGSKLRDGAHLCVTTPGEAVRDDR